VTTAIAAGDKTCAACHATTGHTLVHEPATVPPSCTGSGCHAGTNLVPIHSKSTCATCHGSTRPAVTTAIAAGDKTCAACHGTTGHVALHTAAVSAVPMSGTLVNVAGTPFTLWNGAPQTYAGQTCGQCHLMDLMAEHTKPTSNVAAQACAACHPSPRDSFVSWNETCQQSGCHATALHSQMATKHAWTPAETEWESCGSFTCHVAEWERDLAALHDERFHWGSTVGVNFSAYPDGCGFCHTATRVPVAIGCSSCHPSNHGPAPLP
jgi:hypothetical protein